MNWLGSIIVAITFLFLCLDGYHTEIPLGRRSRGDFFGEPPLINWTHGWPCYFIVRSSIYPLAVGKGGPRVKSFTGDAGFYSRWPIDEAPAYAFNPLALVIDIVAFAVLVTGTWLGMDALSLRTGISFRFGLRTLFILTTVVAIALALNVASHISRHAVEIVALTIMGLAGVATVITVVWAGAYRLSRAG